MCIRDRNRHVLSSLRCVRACVSGGAGALLVRTQARCALSAGALQLPARQAGGVREIRALTRREQRRLLAAALQANPALLAALVALRHRRTRALALGADHRRDASALSEAREHGLDGNSRAKTRASLAKPGLCRRRALWARYPLWLHRSTIECPLRKSAIHTLASAPSPRPPSSRSCGPGARSSGSAALTGPGESRVAGLGRMAFSRGRGHCCAAGGPR